MAQKVWVWTNIRVGDKQECRGKGAGWGKRKRKATANLETRRQLSDTTTMTRFSIFLLTLLIACGSRGDRSPARILVVFNAGSLARPLRAAMDSFAQREGVTALQESAGSLETARKLTELGKVPDVVALAEILMDEGIDVAQL